MEAMDPCPLGVDERAAGVFLGPDPYRELELYLEKVNEEIGEVFDRWNDTPADFKSNGNVGINKNTISTNGYRGKYSSDSSINKYTTVNGHNDSIQSSQNNYQIIKNQNALIEKYSNGNHKGSSLNKIDRNFKVNAAKYRKFSSKAALRDDDISDNFLLEFNEIVAKKLLSLSLKESPANMPYKNVEVDDSESDHDYDDVFASDEDDSNFRNSRVSRSKSLEDSTSYKPKTIETNQQVSSPTTEKRTHGLFNLSPTKTALANFLKKSKERVPSLSSKAPGEAVLVSVGSLPDVDLVESVPVRIEDRRSTDPEVPEYATITNTEPLLTKRKFLISKSVTNSPQLVHKNKDVTHNNNIKEDKSGNLSESSVLRHHRESNYSQNTRANRKNCRIYENISRDGEYDKEFDEVDCQSKPRSPHDVLQDIFPHVLFRRGGETEETPIWMKDRADYQSASGLQSLQNATISLKDAETQTHETPSISRSSSCTWNSECSSSLFNTGSTNASASDDETAAVDDDIRSSSSSGLEVGGAGEPNEPGEPGGEESGIGTASPPLKLRKEHFEKTPNKCKRKETWERLRRRQSQHTRHLQYFRASTGNDVWVRRESVTTQTVDPEEVDAVASDHTCNTEDMSSNENLLLDESANETSANETSISENSLRRNILSRRINAGNSPMNFPSSNSSAVNNDDVNDSGLNSSESSIPNSCAKPTSKPIRPTCLQLKIVNIPPLAAMDSQSSSGDCLDDFTECREFFGQFSGREQPSPSSASLKLSLAPMPSDLGGKCASVPALLRRRVPEKGSLRRGEGLDSEDNMLHKLRAQSEKQLLGMSAHCL